MEGQAAGVTLVRLLAADPISPDAFGLVLLALLVAVLVAVAVFGIGRRL